ncbi:MAG: hypothetical protein ACOX36_05720 [Saccharofermentanales bacterium]
MLHLVTCSRVRDGVRRQARGRHATAEVPDTILAGKTSGAKGVTVGKLVPVFVVR